MSLFNVFRIAGSGLEAQTVRINTTASNLANADTVAGSPEQAYRAKHPVFAAEFNAIRNGMNAASTNETGSGVVVQGIYESDATPTMRHDPNHPMANEEGYVFGANVNTIEEMVNMISASRSYQNNIEVMNASKEMMMRTLSLGK
jgi:flagellar basal-body rod protein FlgC